MIKLKSQFIVRKYIMASSAREAIRLDKKTPVHDVWIDEDWKKAQSKQRTPAIGFEASEDDENDEE